jgi:hypothetical protein
MTYQDTLEYILWDVLHYEATQEGACHICPIKPEYNRR